MRRSVRLVIVAGAGMAIAAASERERTISSDGMVAATLNGVPGRVRVDPGALGMPLVTADWASRAKLKPGMIGIGYGIGNVVVAGHTAVARIDTGDGPERHRVGWTARPYAAGIDGVVGPGGLAEPVIRFDLRPAGPGERTVAIPMVDGGGLFGGFGGLFGTLDVDGDPIMVRFDPYHARTLATAGAAQRIAAERDGRMNGETTPAEIAFGIERPVRSMTLGRPIAIGPLSLTSLGVRTRDFGNAGAIPDADARADPDEVVVTAKGKHDRRRDKLSIGADYLSHCSSIVFDKPARVIRLTCG
ncbi:MAG: hypothetical protein J0I47_11175 [Sphingomonas sp.]|uniref:hypothetical protein n=1 Tax=Sphingomonas sp. TaxID=28214 RepID=UPI001AD2F158|nr:hypothetical protein [Sphingomonas sp.]MBN8808774.1 hypothetical protein [Sphingomonas sp.]